MAIESVQDVATSGDDVGVYGLLAGVRDLRVDVANDVARAFAYMDTARLSATANRAANTIEAAATALHVLGELLVAHDPKVDAVHSTDVGAAVTMLVDLSDGARMIKSDADYELGLRRQEAASAHTTHAAEG